MLLTGTAARRLAVRSSPLSGRGAGGEGRVRPDVAAVIEARDLQKTYVLGRVRVPALRGVSLRIERGEIVAIVGPSGAARRRCCTASRGWRTSTLVRCGSRA